MLPSSPYDIAETAHVDRLHRSRVHPAVQVRITLMECLEYREFDSVWELHWETKTAILWDLRQRKIVNEIKWLDPRNKVENTNNMTFEETVLLRALYEENKQSPFVLLSDLLFVAMKQTNNASHTLYVFWPLKAYTQSQLEELSVLYLKPRHINNIIVVSERMGKTQSFITMLEYRGITATFFSYDDLKFNITKHVLVPTYRVVSESKLRENGLRPQDLPNLPTLLTTDPVCVFCGWPQGTVLRIESVTGKPTSEYRIVRPSHTYRETPTHPTAKNHPLEPKQINLPPNTQPRRDPFKYEITEFLKNLKPKENSMEIISE
jgi:DNA-directed RNA polymerase subunit H (RpoH/RPB5)